MEEEIKNLGKRIKKIRLNKGLTQEQLATRSGLAKSYISLLESGKKIPAIFTLSKIADAFGISIGNFFEITDDTSDVAFVKKEDRIKIEKNGSSFGYIYEALCVQKKNRVLDAFVVTILPRKKGKKRIEFEHPGEEFDFIIKGSARYTIDNKEYILEEGDAIHFDSTLKHSVEAIGDEPVVTLSVHAQDVP